jgi:hypothetical protein
MNFKAPFLILLVLVTLLFTAGCSSSAPQQTGTPTGATPIPTLAVSTTTLSTGSGGSTQPGPTDTLPSATPVSVSVEKAGTYSTTIITTFDGGKGMSAVSKIDVRVTRSDGSVVTGTLRPLKGETLELEGTRGTDRVEVIILMNSGILYKVVDQQMPFKTRG